MSIKTLYFKILDYWRTEDSPEADQKKVRLFVGMILQGSLCVVGVLMALAPITKIKYLIPGWVLLAEMLILLVGLKLIPRYASRIYAIHIVMAITIICWVTSMLPISTMMYCQAWIIILPLMGIFLLGPRIGLAVVVPTTTLGSAIVVAYVIETRELNITETLFLAETIGFCQLFAYVMAGSGAYFFWSMERLEKSIRRKDQQLRDSEIVVVQSAKWAAIGEIAHGVAHEINNPLFIACGGVEGLKKNPHLSQKDQKIMNSVEKALGRIKEIVSALSKSSIEERNNVTAICELNEIVDCALDMCRSSFEARHVKIKKSIEPGLRARCQLNEVVEALTNILRNARDAVKDQDNKTIEIITTKVDSNQVQIQVTDHGIGIPKELEERIFEPFFMHGKDVGEGRGLGLAVARANCLKNNGAITLNRFAGTTFSIRLPRK